MKHIHAAYNLQKQSFTKTSPIYSKSNLTSQLLNKTHYRLQMIPTLTVDEFLTLPYFEQKILDYQIA